MIDPGTGEELEFLPGVFHPQADHWSRCKTPQRSSPRLVHFGEGTKGGASVRQRVGIKRTLTAGCGPEQSMEEMLQNIHADDLATNSKGQRLDLGTGPAEVERLGPESA